MRIAALLLALFVFLGCSSPSGRPSGDRTVVGAPAAPEDAQPPATSGDTESTAEPGDTEPSATPGDAGAPVPSGEPDATAPEHDWDARARKADERLAQLRRELSHPIFVPTRVPDGLHPLMPSKSGRLVSIAYVDDDLNRLLSVASGPLGCCIDPDARKMVGGGTPIRDGCEARFIPNQPEFGGNILWWQEDGAYVALAGPHLTEEELLAIAESLSPTATLTGPPDADP